MYNRLVTEIPQPEPESKHDITELPFTEIQRGDIIIVETRWFILKEERKSTYTIKVDGVRKKGLQVRVENFHAGRLTQEFSARCPGVIALKVRGGEPIPTFRVSDENQQYNLHFENIHNRQGGRTSKPMASANIQKITLVRKSK